MLSLQLLRALLQSLLIVQRRKLTNEHAKLRRAELVAQQEAATQAAAAIKAAEQPDAGKADTANTAPVSPVASEFAIMAAPAGPTSIVPAEELRADVEAHTEQSCQLLSLAVVTVSLAGIWMIWVDVLPALRILDQWQLWATTVDVAAEDVGMASTTGSIGPLRGPGMPVVSNDGTVQREIVTVVRHVTPRDIGLALLIVVLTVACARNIPGLMEMWILQRLPFDQSVRYAITTLTRYLIILLGVILSFNAISVGWSKVQWRQQPQFCRPHLPARSRQSAGRH